MMSSASDSEPRERAAIMYTMGAKRFQVSAVAQVAPPASPRAKSPSLISRQSDSTTNESEVCKRRIDKGPFTEAYYE